MKANCGNCFWKMGGCRNVENLARFAVIENHELVFDDPSVSDDFVCSNWQAKNTKDMKCDDCRYNYGRSAGIYNCRKNIHVEHIDDNFGCVNFWPEDTE